MSARTKMGLAAIVLVALAGGLWLWRPNGASGAMILLRSGLVLGATWLAWPELQRIPRWLAITGAICLVLLVRFPALVFVMLPAIAVVRWVMKPKQPRRLPQSRAGSRLERAEPRRGER